MHTSLLIKNARVIDHQSKFHQQKVDILIKEGKIAQIGNGIDVTVDETVAFDNLHVSPGWFDMRANFCDPGEEHKEDVHSGLQAAAIAGFTSVALSPQTKPAIDSKANVQYLIQKGKNAAVNIYPLGAITKGLHGEELSEMYDMHKAGAAGFSNGDKAITNNNVLKLALQYSREFAPPLHVLAFDPNLRHGGQMHEGEKSTLLGLPGISALSEEVAVLNLLHIAKYAEAKVHLNGISSKEALDLLNRDEYKETFTCDVSIAHLIFNEENLTEYDSNFKVFPPLRRKIDQQALLDALVNGQISAVVSNHQPQSIEDKSCEYQIADWGMATLEFFFGALRKATHEKIDLAQLISLISHNPRKLLNIEQPQIAEGSLAELTLFDPDAKWHFDPKNKKSKAYNYPVISKPLLGKALGIVNNSRWALS